MSESTSRWGKRFSLAVLTTWGGSRPSRIALIAFSISLRAATIALSEETKMLVGAVLDRALARGGEGIVRLKAGAHSRVGLGFHRFAVLQKVVGLVTHQSVIRT